MGAIDELELLASLVLALDVLASVLEEVEPPPEDVLALDSSSPSLRTPATS